MGNQETKEEEDEAAVLENPQVGEASDLYWACRGGDLDVVKDIISTIPFSDVNHLETNGSTALHATSFFGHVKVVRYLLQERDIIRHPGSKLLRLL
jgi:ankyrin repeat protein